MSGWFGSPAERERDDGGDFVATVCLVAAGVAIALYVFLRALGGEALGGLAAGVVGGLVLGCVAARLDEPAGHWAGASLLAGLAASGTYMLGDPATLAPSSYALALWLAVGVALLAAAPAILAGERLQLDCGDRTCAPSRGAGCVSGWTVRRGSGANAAVGSAGENGRSADR